MIDVPDLFQPGNCGAQAVVSAVKEALASPGKVVELIVADHPNYGREVYFSQLLGVGYVNGAPALRYCGEGGKPLGASSSSVISSGGEESLDVAQLVAILALQLGREQAKANDKARTKSPMAAGWFFRGEAYRAHFKTPKSAALATTEGDRRMAESLADYARKNG